MEYKINVKYRKILLSIILLILLLPLLTLIKALPSKPLARIESPWAVRELYYINGTLWWRHVVKAYVTRIPFGDVVLWYPVYSDPSSTINITVEYSWTEKHQSAFGIPVYNYYIILGYTGLLEDRWFPTNREVYFAEIPAISKNFRKTYRVKLPEGEGVLVLILALVTWDTEYKEYCFHTCFYIFSTIVGYSSDLDFSKSDYDKALSVVESYENLLKEKEEFSVLAEKFSSEIPMLKEKLADLVKEVDRFNATKQTLLNELNVVNAEYSALKSNASVLENKLSELKLEKKTLLAEISDYRFKTIVFATASVVILIVFALLKRKEILALALVALIAFTPVYTTPVETKTIVINGGLWTCTLKVPVEISYKVRIEAYLSGYTGANTWKKSFRDFFRIDKTGLGWEWQGEFMCCGGNDGSDELWAEYEAAREWGWMGVPYFDSRIPLNKECSYAVKDGVGVSEKWNITFVYLTRRRTIVRQGYTFCTITHSFKGDFFHLFNDLVNISRVLCVGCLESEVYSLRNHVSELNSTVYELNANISSLKSLVSSLKEDIVSINASICEKKALISDLEAHIEELKEEIADLEKEVQALRQEKSLWVNLHNFALATLVLVVIGVIVYVIKSRLLVVVVLLILFSVSLLPTTIVKSAYIIEWKWDAKPKTGAYAENFAISTDSRKSKSVTYVLDLCLENPPCILDVVSRHVSDVPVAINGRALAYARTWVEWSRKEGNVDYINYVVVVGWRDWLREGIQATLWFGENRSCLDGEGYFLYNRSGVVKLVHSTAEDKSYSDLSWDSVSEEPASLSK